MTAAPALALYGHPFSSYTWKAQIALDAAGIEPEFRIIDPNHPENYAFVTTQGGPFGLFPVLVDGGEVIFEATSIIEYAHVRLSPQVSLLPSDPDAALCARMLDRVFDNYVMAPMQAVVNEYLRDRVHPDATRVAESRAKLRKSYAWLEGWLPSYHQAPDRVTLIECAAAPSLFYADWVEPIADAFPRLKAWREHLLALPPVSRCVEAARPYRSGFPLGAPDRD
ncbi:MAG: glutathione S-transferase family protein [Novosphingobium sp.]